MGASWQSLDITAVMSRHRKRGRPALMSRAVRRKGWSGRAAWLVGGLARVATVPVTGVLAVIRSMRRHAGTWEVIRGMLLTPWFAVGAGIVVAVSATLAAPRAVLVFPPQASGRCADVGCHAARQAAKP